MAICFFNCNCGFAVMSLTSLDTVLMGKYLLCDTNRRGLKGV